MGNQAVLDAKRAASPRPHELLNKSGKILLEDLSAFQMVQELEKMEEEGKLCWGDEPRYEVHYVGGTREFRVLDAPRFLKEFRRWAVLTDGL